MIPKSWSSTKHPNFGKTEAEAKISQDMSQHLKGEIPNLSQPGCGLCRELGHPLEEVLGVSARSVLD